MPHFSGIHHLAITISELDRSVDFYSRLWDTNPVGWLPGVGLKRRMFQLPDGTMIGLTLHDAGIEGSFNPKTPGMDHVGFEVEGPEALEEWVEHLDSMNIEHGGIVAADYGLGLSVKDPDGTALEFFAPASA